MKPFFMFLIPFLILFESCKNQTELPLFSSDKYTIYSDSLVQNPYKAITVSASSLTSDYPILDSGKIFSWELSTDISHFPQYHSDQKIVDALYNMSLEELIKDIRSDSTFMAGEKWDGVWTRDISYSITLSLASIAPELSKNSLLRKVKNKRIIQDTGTGGSWPISTDRLTWALAAWEIYKVTADRDWLKQAYEIIKNSLDDDKKVAFDEKTGLMYGESSFLDWREQSYPVWMQPVDIYESKNLGTNAVHYQANKILSAMAVILNEPNTAYEETAEKIKEGINSYLWMEEKGYYGQYLYGRYIQELSPRSEALGEALCVLFNIPDSSRQKEIIENTPVTEYGIPCIYPQIPGIQPYHNNAVWPFVEAFWTMASAKAQNETSVLRGLGAIYRPAALFLTNKENMVAETGDEKGTVINSNRQLWSVAGNIAMVYKVFFGMDFQPEGIIFHPFVPESFKGKKELAGFSYRSMNLTLRLKGYGNEIKAFRIDGVLSKTPFLPGDLSGDHRIEIELENSEILTGKVNLQPITFLAFPPLSAETTTSEIAVLEAEKFASGSDLPYKGFSGKGFVELSKQKNTTYSFTADIPEAGEYLIEFRYSNGSGPINTENKCAIRTLKLNSEMVGSIVFPQRGTNEWSVWGESNSLPVSLSKGLNHLSLVFEPWNENMNGEINTCMLDQIRILKLLNKDN
ncbi:MAG: glycogen debranching protein [Bacteroidales bacterium]|nr:glycogen debranching protein [Bacteroidales bacterium]MCB8999534.1 glycogen debranching protein [Bacteroidales bacterium]MCB9012955.1 glycogen debranching protein [Bacteroidales bacterium]